VTDFLERSQDAVCQAFGIPDFLCAWIEQFFEPDEFDLILALESRPLSGKDLHHVLSGTTIEAAQSETFVFANWLERAYTRGIINKAEDDRFELADFHVRFEVWALFEGWKDIPQDIQRQLNEWELAYYEECKRGIIARLRQGLVVEERSEYVLLHEAEALFEEAEHIYLWPCNCRAMMQRCKQSVYTCLRFTNDRGLGWEISKERAKKITREANQKGLMQLGEVSRASDGSFTGGLCNCCSDCCYPHLLAERVGSQKIWPTSRHIAVYHQDACTGCGACVRRCPFQAFEKGPEWQTTKEIVFISERCRGCGLCATGCPEKAVSMQPL
jgi:Pyruvate/2-oxoacid:ferredoxin oxidoreductase delta subunit